MIFNISISGYFGQIAYNGRSIGEVRAFGELKVQERLNEADAFSMQ